MRLIPLLASLLFLAACSAGAARDGEPVAPAPSPQETAPVNPTPDKKPDPAPTRSVSATASTTVKVGPASASSTETATFAGGCYWCIEAVLETVPGVIDAKSGFMGGTVQNPTYEQVCEGDTGAAEVVQVTFDPAKLSYADLLEWFWKAHDPTTKNRQGADVGTQYRSAIFVHSDAQRAAAERSMAAAQSHYASPIVTEIVAASAFTTADEHHQDFYRLNKSYGYCRAVITPKMKKLGLEK
ncbi:MAG: peptide-methionine (S)-S-oxide reductase MsrA [Planctomycetes bacterium]|nr:peptide-methionine (S)-S-oxide reductase MsrA [Planctomycetota bacterium]